MPKTTISIKSDERDEFLAAVKKGKMKCKFIKSDETGGSFYEVEFKEPYHLFYLGMRYQLLCSQSICFKT